MDHLQRREETLALAESMSGGRMSAMLTSIPGASRVLLGGATVYGPMAKGEWAGLTPDFLAEHGTVSEATTQALAEGVRRRLGATWGVAITGNAGPGEDPNGPAPVGTFFMAVAGPDGTRCRALQFPGERGDIQIRASIFALDFLRRHLL